MPLNSSQTGIEKREEPIHKYSNDSGYECTRADSLHLIYNVICFNLHFDIALGSDIVIAKHNEWNTLAYQVLTLIKWSILYSEPVHLSLKWFEMQDVSSINICS